MTDKAVYRTAPATPGLLISIVCIMKIQLESIHRENRSQKHPYAICMCLYIVKLPPDTLPL